MVRPPFRLASLVACLLLLSLAGSASADPRWWWSDQQLSFTDSDSITPHVAGASQEGALIQGGALFVTYAEVDPAEGDLEIWLSASFDSGCSFCTPTRITDNAIDDTNPRIAGLVDATTTTFSLALAYESANRVELAWDLGRIPTWGNPGEQCTALEGMGPALRAGGQVHVFGAPGSIADSPDVSALSNFTTQQFHLVWHDTRNAKDDIYTARDLTGLSGAAWLADPPRNLTPGSPPSGQATSPRVVVAAFTDPDPISGLPTGDRLSVDVVFVDEADGGVYGLRSVDNGDTFSPDGQRADAPAARLSDPASVASRPALSASALPWAIDHWQATAWEDRRGAGPAPEVFMDARFFDMPAAPALPWQAPDAAVATPLGMDDGRPTIGVMTGFGGGDVPSWVAWQDDRFGAREIVTRSSMLEALTGIDLNALAFPPVRPLDPTSSLIHQLTHCSFDEITFDCLPDRIAGEAREPSLIADFENVFLVFADTRDGVSNIYFKRTDRWVWGSAPRLSSECTDPVTTRVNIEFDVQASCPAPFAGERMLRYRLYHGPTPGGPYVNAAAPIEVTHDLSLGALVRLDFDGYATDEQVCVIVVPEDEAHNVAPEDFDPTVTAAVAPFNETCFRTAAACAPALRALCVSIGDRCPANPALDDDGNAQPGEQIPIEIEILNVGSAPATAYSGTLLAAGATVLEPAGGLLTIADIPPGQTRRVSALLELPRLAGGALCGDAVDLTLTGQVSNGSLVWPDSGLVACDFTLGPDPGCVDCAATPALVVRSFSVGSDSCSLGAGSGDGILDPGESALLQVEIVNAGLVPAVDVTARLELLAGATTGDPLTVGPVSLAPGAVHVALLNVDIVAACGDVVEAAVRDLAEGGSGLSFDDTLSPSFRVGGSPSPIFKRYAGTSFFSVPDGGSVESPNVLTTFEGPVVDGFLLTVQGFFNNRPNVAADLIGPSGRLDVSAALDAPLDLTDEYAGVLGGVGDYRLEVRELAPDIDDPQVWNWSIEIDDTDAACNDCALAPECLHRVDVSSLSPHVPARAVVYLPSRDGEDLGIAGAAIACPFASGNQEPDGSALSNGVPLSLYQVNRPGVVLRLRKEAGTIRFDY